MAAPARPLELLAAPGADGGARRDHVSEVQRSRLLAAVSDVVCERGYAQTSVADITARARVSRRTFYELFSNREACMVALIDGTAARVRAELATAGLEGAPWRERVRGGLWRILCFLDRERDLARVCVVESQSGGPEVLAARERVLAELVRVLDEGRRQGARSMDCTLVTAEGLVGAAHGVIHARLARHSRESLGDLLGELTAVIAMQYFGAAAARRELARSTPAPVVQLARSTPRKAQDPLQGVPMRLTYRTMCVLESIAGSPGASNRVIADRAGVHDQGQVSKLLARLARLELVVNEGAGQSRGEANSWRLTPLGERVAASVCRPEHALAKTAAAGGTERIGASAPQVRRSSKHVRIAQTGSSR